jgi:ubiquinone/menaquinone biosynthesis C-methylase UbiE
MSDHVSNAPVVKQVSYPRFAAFYNWMTGRSMTKRMFEPLRRETAGQADGVVLEVGAGGGQNFPFYDATRVERVEAIEPDEAMLAYARRALVKAPVPITLTRASAEKLPFPDAHFNSVVMTLAFCSVNDPERSMQEIRRVLKPRGTLFLLEHVRTQGKMAGWLQDALVPMTTRLLGNCHWNRDTRRAVVEAGFQITRLRQVSGGLQPVIFLHAVRSKTNQQA